MIAEVGGIVNVSGSRIATPLAPPSPGGEIRTTIRVAGHSTLSTGPSRARVTNGLSVARCHACMPIVTDAKIRITPSQNGKNPARGPSVPQPMPIRRESRTTTPPSKIRIDAVARSAARILLFQQPALGHQLLVELLVVLHPLHVLGAGR